jgi:hypothetical protein
MDPWMNALRQWWTAQSPLEATSAVIALAVARYSEEVERTTPVCDSSNDYDDEGADV